MHAIFVLYFPGVRYVDSRAFQTGPPIEPLAGGLITDLYRQAPAGSLRTPGEGKQIRVQKDECRYALRGKVRGHTPI